MSSYEGTGESAQSIRCSHECALRMGVDEDSGQKLDFSPHWIHQQGR